MKYGGFKLMNINTTIVLSLIIFVIFFFKSETIMSKKVMKLDGKLVECKSPKNSFERTRGVRTRICIFKKNDETLKDEIEKEKVPQKKY